MGLGNGLLQLTLNLTFLQLLSGRLKIQDSRVHPAAGKVQAGVQEGSVPAGLMPSLLLAVPMPELGTQLFFHLWVTLYSTKFRQCLDYTVNLGYLQFIIKS